MIYDWPGNVRELENVIMRALVLSREDIILENHISIEPREMESLTAWENPFKSLKEMEKEYVAKALIKAKGHMGETCELLKISRPTLRKKIEKYNIQKG